MRRASYLGKVNFSLQGHECAQAGCNAYGTGAVSCRSTFRATDENGRSDIEYGKLLSILSAGQDQA